MDIVELIRNADSAPEIFAALAVYAESLRHVAAIPDWCLAPFKGESDLRERVFALFAVVNLTSQHRLDRDCNAAKGALRAFAAALQRLNRRSPSGQMR